jgi:photosystem II stability/assembly factor-like uncharacterized protein
LLDWPDLDALELDDEELDRTLELAKRRSRVLRSRRARRHSILAAITLSVTVALVGATVFGANGAKTRTQRLVTAPSWKLVSDVGPSWQEVSTIGDDAGFGLSCPTTTTCYAEAFSGQPIEVTHDGGTTWQQSTLPADITRPGSLLACTTADTCSLLGQDGSGNGYFLTTEDGGQTWSTQPGPWHVTRPSILALSCSTATSCLAVASSGSEIRSGDGGASGQLSAAFVTTDGGRSWSESDLPQGFVALSDQCLAGGVCLAVGGGSGGSAPGAALYSTNGGSTWSPASVPAGTGPLNSLSCSDGDVCIATAMEPWQPGGDAGPTPSDVLVTTDGGQSWSATNTAGLPNSFLTSVSCPSSSDCWTSGVVIGQSSTGNRVVFADTQGLLVTTADQGQNWQTSQLPEDVRAVGAVSCPSTTTCYALGFQKPASGDGNGGFVLLSSGG